MPQGRRFGKYLLHDKLAVGGMGELYLATIVGAAKGTPPSVLKILLPEYSSDADFVSMFHDEARLGMQLNHANIVVVQDLGRVQDTPYLVMEYVHGENLRNVARRIAEMRERFPPDIAVRVMIEVLRGLEYAHQANDSRGRPLNLVHRDLSPDNVMLSFDGDVKILDFGIAKAEGRATQTQFGILKGKAQYMAPEQALGQPVDERTDLYAIGLVLLEVLTGERRFGAEVDPIQQIRDARVWKPTEPSKRDSSLPVELDAILLKSMQLDAKRRFQNAGEFADALTRLLKSGSLPRTGENVPRLMRRLFPDRAEPFLLFEEDSTAPKPDPRRPGAPRPAAAPPRTAPTMDDVSIEIIEPSADSLEATRLGGGFLSSGRTMNPDAEAATAGGAVRPREPSMEATVPPRSVAGARAKAIGTFDDDRTNSAFTPKGGADTSDSDPTNKEFDNEPTASGFDLDAPTQDSLARKAGRGGAAVPRAPSEAPTENTGPGDGGGDLDDRTAVGTRPPPPSRGGGSPRSDDTIPPTKRPSFGGPPPPPAPKAAPSSPKFREAPPPPPAKFRDVKNLRDLPEVPSAGDEFMADQDADGTRVAGPGQGPSRVSAAALDPPARIVERRRGDAAIPVAPRARRKKSVIGRLFVAFLFLLLFSAGLGFGLLQSGRLPPEVQAQAETRLEPLFAAVPALRPKPRGTPADRVATAGSGQVIAMNASPTPSGDDDDGAGDDDDAVQASPEATGRVMTGGGVFPGGDDDDDGASTPAATATAMATATGTPVATATPAPSRTAVAMATPRPTEKPVATAPPATPRPTREVVATPKPTQAPSGGKASVKVISTPPGVEILIDGQGTGKKTPATVQVEPGTRTIGLKMDGFRPWTFKEDFRAGDTLQLPVDLQPL